MMTIHFVEVALWVFLQKKQSILVCSWDGCEFWELSSEGGADDADLGLFLGVGGDVFVDEGEAVGVA